jgi:hypothetical protein
MKTQYLDSISRFIAHVYKKNLKTFAAKHMWACATFFFMSAIATFSAIYIQLEGGTSGTFQV